MEEKLQRCRVSSLPSITHTTRCFHYYIIIVSYDSDPSLDYMPTEQSFRRTPLSIYLTGLRNGAPLRKIKKRRRNDYYAEPHNNVVFLLIFHLPLVCEAYYLKCVLFPFGYLGDFPCKPSDLHSEDYTHTDTTIPNINTNKLVYNGSAPNEWDESMKSSTS